MAAIAARILATAPPRFALAGLSMGGYIAFAIVRQAPERVARARAARYLGARPIRRSRASVVVRMIALAEGGRFAELPDLLFPVFVHRNRQGDEALRAAGAPSWLRRPDARGLRAPAACDRDAPGLRAAARIDPLSDARAGRRRRRADAACAVGGDRCWRCRRATRSSYPTAVTCRRWTAAAVTSACGVAQGMTLLVRVSEVRIRARSERLAGTATHDLCRSMKF